MQFCCILSIFLFVVKLNAIPTPSNQTCDPRDHFYCPEERCIPKEWHCDGEIDCENGQDEKNCHHCTQGDFRCTTDGNCISTSFLCDGDLDCEDGSDEDHCPRPPAPPKSLICSSRSFSCGDACISRELVCDGAEDCRDGSDERNCQHHGYRIIYLASREIRSNGSGLWERYVGLIVIMVKMLF